MVPTRRRMMPSTKTANRRRPAEAKATSPAPPPGSAPLPRIEQHRGEVAHQILAAHLLLFDAQLLPVLARHFLHQVVARGGGQLVRAEAEREEELPLLQADAVADQAQHARRSEEHTSEVQSPDV